MHDVIFKYRPITWFPYQKEIKTTHPESWDELMPDQFESIVAFLNSFPTKASHVLLTNSLLSLKNPLYDFPDEIFNLKNFIKIDEPFSTVLIKTICPGKNNLYGPSNQFRNVSIGEFAFGETYYLKFMNDKNEKLLYKMIAVYYRRKSEEFNPDIIDTRGSLISELPARTKNAILFNYQVVRRWIQKLYPYIFPETSENEIQIKRESSTWRDFVRNLVNGDYVNEEKILKTLMHTVLSDINENIRKQKTKKK